MTNTFSARIFLSTVSGSAGGAYAKWFFEHARELIKHREQQLDDAMEFKDGDVADVIRRVSTELVLLDKVLQQVQEHCKNLPLYLTSVQSARDRIEKALVANKAYIDVARGGKGA